ncbi:MAG: hypothetical protein R3F11_21930 [Verrucomicrobiales bacterium]
MTEFNIYRVSKAGDTVEAMIYRTDFGGDYSLPNPARSPALEGDRSTSPRLSSSPGAATTLGDELAGYLNHVRLRSLFTRPLGPCALYLSHLPRRGDP